MNIKKYNEIKEKMENLNEIQKIKYLSEELSKKEIKDFFEYEKFIKFQKEWIGF